MIAKIQSNITFKAIYLKRNDDSVKNIKHICEIAEASESPFDENESDRIKGAFRYGLNQLNDGYTNDSETRFLTFKPVYDKTSGLPSGYCLSIVNDDGSEFAKGCADMPVAGADALRFAFEDLKINYENKLSSLALEQYAKYLEMRKG